MCDPPVGTDVAYVAKQFIGVENQRQLEPSDKAVLRVRHVHAGIFSWH
jgi:hypothetical protein